MGYGVPYKGSKQKIAEWVISYLPAAETFVDLFAGGCAVTHCAMLSGKYEHFIINDLEPGITQLFADAINGKYHNDDRWISREMFELLKDGDPYVRYCWSFGNNGRDYIYARELEPYKKLLHELLHCQTVNGRRLLYRQTIRALNDYLITTKKYMGFPLQSLQSLERLESLESLELDYQEVPIPENSVIYCDIPYKGTDEYNTGAFDYDRFYDWACSQTQPIYISEYDMPQDRFEIVAEKEKRCTLPAFSNKRKTIERIYRPRQ